MPTLAEQIIPRRKLLLMVSETVIFVAVLFLGTSVEPFATREFSFALGSEALWRGLLTCLTIAIICQASLSYSDLYDWRVSQNRAELPNRLVHSCGYALVMLAILVLAMPALLVFPGLKDVGQETWKLILLLGFSFLLIYGWRLGFHWFFYKWRFGEQVLILGTGEPALSLAKAISENRMSGFEVLGLVGDGNGDTISLSPPDTPPHKRVLGSALDLPRLAHQHSVGRVVIALTERRGALPVSELLLCRMAGVLVEEREAMYERLHGKIAVESMRPSYLIFGRGFTKSPVVLVGKRVMDVLLSSIGLVLSLPLCVLAVLLIKLDSRGPVFFRQERVGEDGQRFHIVKFRTMRADAEKESGPVWATDQDQRITRAGRLLRITRIDEIPQFYNILTGRMSFVGPRPERPYFVEQLEKDLPFYMLRHTVKPGLTGWAQVSHRYGSSVEDAREKLRYELYYIKNMGLLFDLNIILRTVGVILFGKGAR